MITCAYLRADAGQCVLTRSVPASFDFSLQLAKTNPFFTSCTRDVVPDDCVCIGLVFRIVWTVGKLDSWTNPWVKLGWGASCCKMQNSSFVGVVYLVSTRMHSSRMRTVRNSSRLVTGGCLVVGGGVSSGGLLQGGRLVGGGPWPGGVCSGEGWVLSQHALRQTPPVNRMTDRQV